VQANSGKRSANVLAVTTCGIAFLSPLVILVSGQRALPAIPNLSLALLDALLVMACLFRLIAHGRARVDKSIYLIVAALGTCLLLSSLYAATFSERSVDARVVLLLMHLVLPYYWFVLAGPSSAKPIADGDATAFLLAGLFCAGIWHIGQAGLVVAQEGASAWIALAQVSRANSNVIGMMLVLGICIMLPSFAGTHVIAQSAMLSVFALGVMWSFSRSSYLAFAAVSVAFVMRNKKGWLVFTAVAVVGVIVYQAMPSLAEAPTARLAFTVESGELDASSKVRIDLWKASLESFAENPILGTGFGRSVALLNEQLGVNASRLVYSHNFFLTLASQAGVLALTLAILFFARAYKISRRFAGPAGERVRLATIGIFVASLFGEPLLVPPFLVMYLLLLTGVTLKTSTTRP
jgi:O-antigen ligase